MSYPPEKLYGSDWKIWIFAAGRVSWTDSRRADRFAPVERRLHASADRTRGAMWGVDLLFRCGASLGMAPTCPYWPPKRWKTLALLAQP